MLGLVNRGFVGFLIILAILGIMASIIVLGLSMVLGPETIDTISTIHHPDFSIQPINIPLSISDSPHEINLTLKTPKLTSTSLLYLKIYANGKSINEIDCLEEFYETSDYVGLTKVDCIAYIPYNYEGKGNYEVFAILEQNGKEYSTDPLSFVLDWSDYEVNFWEFSTIAFFLLVGVYVAIIVPVVLLILKIASETKHKLSFPGEYSLRSLLHPFANTSTILQKFYSLITSPYFWAFEFIGIIFILSYMVMSAEAWKSLPALTGFVISGMAAFFIPFLWCAAWWYVDFKEREPVRILITLFLWGMLSALMAIGINTLAGVLFGILGLGFLSSFLVAPIIEEGYKGSGLSLLSEHHEYDSIEDGIVYGFVIGMGFAFIEDWIYFLNNPMGSDIIGWVVLFILRSIVFSANHGFYTAITGAVIAFFIIRGFRAPGLGILIGMPIAALFHAMHNSVSILTALFGVGGVLLYCCFLVPIFDYGGVLLIFILFLKAIFTKKPIEGIPPPGFKPKKPQIKTNMKY
ncbi:MAG: PrsW family intramembrane metalloprotease [Candidatus Micrarchaeota archaeon]